jgi:glutaredoxin
MRKLSETGRHKYLESRHSGKNMGLVNDHADEADTDFLIYTATYCPFCTGLKGFLKGKGLTYTEYNFDQQENIRRDIVNETRHQTVPVVIDIRGEQPIFIGGFDETRKYFS